MARKTFLIFWLLSLIPIVLMGSVFYLYTRSTSVPTTIAPQTALWIVAVIAAAVLALVFWLVARWLFKPLQQLNQTARLLAKKRFASPSTTAVSSTEDEAASLAKSLSHIADNWQEMENRLQIQAASYQNSLLALTQFANRAATQTIYSEMGQARDFSLLIAQALEIAVKHLGYSYAAFFAALPSGEALSSSAQEADFLLRQAVVGGRDQPNNVLETPSSIELLQKAFKTSQTQIVTHPDQNDPIRATTLTEIAVPLISVGKVSGILYAHYKGLQSASMPQTRNGPENTAVQSTGAVQFTATLPLAELQILAALTSLETAAAQGQDSIEAAPLNAETTLQATTDGLSAATVQRRLAEFESLWKISQAISTETDLLPLYRLIHEQLSQTMGEMSSFAIVLYTKAKEQLHIPYMIEDGQMVTIPAFPLGEGLSSIVIRSGQPLLLAHSSAEKARALGAIFVGEPAKSWLGVPLTLGGETFGLIIVQDTHHEGRFGEEDQRILSLVAAQVAVVIRNARLIEETRRQAHTQRQIIDITDKIRRSVEVQTILKTTADELATALNTRQTTIKLFATDAAVNLTAAQSPKAEP